MGHSQCDMANECPLIAEAGMFACTQPINIIRKLPREASLKVGVGCSSGGAMDGFQAIILSFAFCWGPGGCTGGCFGGWAGSGHHWAGVQHFREPNMLADWSPAESCTSIVL